MGNEKFTPGPWDVDKDCGQNQVHDSNCNFVACSYSGHFTAEQNTINAHLIAAAPDMYKELEEIKKWLEWSLVLGLEDDVMTSDDLRKEINQIDQLLKKALGEA